MNKKQQSTEELTEKIFCNNKETEKQKPFDYNTKINSLTKQKIISINKDLNIVIKDMQKEIDLYKQKHSLIEKEYISLLNTESDLLDKLILINNQLNHSLKEQLSLIKEKTKLIQQNTETIKSNTRFIKEIMFLNNRNLFQRIFNVQYKKDE
jgi:hypothetical protein